MKISQFAAGAAVASAFFLASGSAVLSQARFPSSTYAVKVLDLNGTGERRAIVVGPSGDPVMYQYDTPGHGSNDLCVIPQNPKTPETCFRSDSFFDHGADQVQHLRFKALF